MRAETKKPGGPVPVVLITVSLMVLVFNGCLGPNYPPEDSDRETKMEFERNRTQCLNNSEQYPGDFGDCMALKGWSRNDWEIFSDEDSTSSTRNLSAEELYERKKLTQD